MKEFLKSLGSGALVLAGLALFLGSCVVTTVQAGASYDDDFTIAVGSVTFIILVFTLFMLGGVEWRFALRPGLGNSNNVKGAVLLGALLSVPLIGTASYFLDNGGEARSHIAEVTHTTFVRAVVLERDSVITVLPLMQHLEKWSSDPWARNAACRKELSKLLTQAERTSTRFAVPGMMVVAAVRTRRVHFGNACINNQPELVSIRPLPGEVLRRGRS